MDFWEVLKVVVRRWIISVPILILTVAVAILLPPRIDPTYSALASTVVITPANSPAGVNPFLALGSVTMAQGLALSADSPASIEQVVAAGGSERFTVSQQNSRSPILNVQVEGGSPEQVVATTEQVLQIIRTQLLERQVAAGAPPETHYYVQDLTGIPAAVPVYDGQQQVRFLAVGIGIGVAVLLALTVEGIAVLRGRRRLRAAEPDELSTIDERLAVLEERERILVERERLLAEREREQSAFGRWAKVGKDRGPTTTGEGPSSEESHHPGHAVDPAPSADEVDETPRGGPVSQPPAGARSVGSRPG